MKSNCILWEGYKKPNGYGTRSHNGKPTYVHRLAYEEVYGPIPKGLCVLHKCDVRHCINPEHLFLGTKLDNNRDRAAKGRSDDRRGSKHPNTHLTEQDILNIRSSSLEGKTLADLYKVSGGTVSMIKSRKIWKHI